MIRVFRDYELDESGVTTVWAWNCSHERCIKENLHGSALYWENTMRGAGHHIAWHAHRGEFIA